MGSPIIARRDVRACVNPTRHSGTTKRLRSSTSVVRFESGAVRRCAVARRNAMTINRHLDDRRGIVSTAENLGGAPFRLGREENNRRYLEVAVELL